MAGPGRRINHPLVAVQHITCTICLGRGAQIGQIIAALRFGIGKGDSGIAGDDLGDHRIGDWAASVLECAAADHHGLQVRLDRDNLAQFLHHDHVFQRAAVHPAVLFGEWRAQNAQILCQGPPDPRIAAISAGQHLLAALKIIGVGKEARERVAQHVLRFGIVEIH